MKILFAAILVALPFMAIHSSCKKAKNTAGRQQQQPPISLGDMLQCYRQTNWDSTAIHNALMGKWQWEFIKCYWNPEDANGDDFKNLSVEFKQHDSLEVKINGQTTQTASWKITSSNDGYFKLVLTPIVVQLPGNILFCGERVLFYDSYTDGCDNYFKKQN